MSASVSSNVNTSIPTTPLATSCAGRPALTLVFRGWIRISLSKKLCNTRGERVPQFHLAFSAFHSNYRRVFSTEPHNICTSFHNFLFEMRLYRKKVASEETGSGEGANFEHYISGGKDDPTSAMYCLGNLNVWRLRSGFVNDSSCWLIFWRWNLNIFLTTPSLCIISASSVAPSSSAAFWNILRVSGNTLHLERFF